MLCMHLMTEAVVWFLAILKAQHKLSCIIFGHILLDFDFMIHIFFLAFPTT